MYNPYNLDLARQRQQELIVAAERSRTARPSREERRARRGVLGRRRS